MGIMGVGEELFCFLLMREVFESFLLKSLIIPYSISFLLLSSVPLSSKIQGEHRKRHDSKNANRMGNTCEGESE